MSALSLKNFLIWWMFLLGIFEFVSVVVLIFNKTERQKRLQWVYFSRFKTSEDSDRMFIVLIFFLGLIRLCFFFAPDNFGIYCVNLITHLVEAVYFFTESMNYGGLLRDSSVLRKQPLGDGIVQFIVYVLNPVLLLLLFFTYI